LFYFFIPLDRVERDRFFTSNDLLAVTSFYDDLDLANTGAHRLAGLPPGGAQHPVVLLR